MQCSILQRKISPALAVQTKNCCCMATVHNPSRVVWLHPQAPCQDMSWRTDPLMHIAAPQVQSIRHGCSCRWRTLGTSADGARTGRQCIQWRTQRCWSACLQMMLCCTISNQAAPHMQTSCPESFSLHSSWMEIVRQSSRISDNLL